MNTTTLAGTTVAENRRTLFGVFLRETFMFDAPRRVINPLHGLDPGYGSAYHEGPRSGVVVDAAGGTFAIMWAISESVVTTRLPLRSAIHLAICTVDGTVYGNSGPCSRGNNGKFDCAGSCQRRAPQRRRHVLSETGTEQLTAGHLPMAIGGPQAIRPVRRLWNMILGFGWRTGTQFRTYMKCSGNYFRIVLK